jgi:hypothetical protein
LASSKEQLDVDYGVLPVLPGPISLPPCSRREGHPAALRGLAPHATVSHQEANHHVPDSVRPTKELTVTYGDEVAYHEHYDLTSSISEVEQQAYSTEQLLQGVQTEVSRLKSEVYDLRSEVSGLRVGADELSGRVEDLEARLRR